MRAYNPWDALADLDLGFWLACYLRFMIVGFASATLGAALWTGAAGGHFFTSMTGFFPPHYGYSAYIVTALVFLAPPPWLRWCAGAALLLSGNRAAWVGVIAGWAWSKNTSRWFAAAPALIVLAVFGGLLLKPAVVRARTDNVRVQIWTTAIEIARQHPEGIGRGNFIRGIAGREVNKAHSDLLQLLVEGGWALTALVVLLLTWGFYRAPAGPSKDLLVCLTAQSVVDNRLHHPACAALYALVWVSAFLDEPRFNS